jgi:hypothetical protein
MIWAVYKDGLFYPAEPVPSHWKNGQRVSVQPEQPATPEDAAAVEAWIRELEQAEPFQFEPGEEEKFKAILDEADAIAKEQVRRQMESED